MRILLLTLALLALGWLGAAPAAHAADVGVPVEIDTFGNPLLPAGPFTRTVTALPLPHTSTTPPGTFSEADSVGSMSMSGLGNGTSGTTLTYRPTVGDSVDLSGGNSNAQIFVDFVAIQGNRGLTVWLNVKDARGRVATSPSDGIGNTFAFNAAFPFALAVNTLFPPDFSHITEINVSFVYPATNTGGGSLQVQVNKIWATPVSGAQPTPPSPTMTAPATAIGVAGATVDFALAFSNNEGKAPVTYNPPSTIGVRPQDLAVSGTAFDGATPKVVVTGGPSNYKVSVSGMTRSGSIRVHVAEGIVSDGWRQLNTASANDPDVAFTFAIPPKFKSPASTTSQVGTASTFVVDANGGSPVPVPTPKLSVVSGTVPSGLSFQDNGNGTASISGTPAAGTGGIVTLTLQANNFAGTVTQSFDLGILEAPSITSAGSATFTVGSAGSFKVTTGHDFPVATSLSAGRLPDGLTFKDNGDGTAAITGTPAAGTGGSHALELRASNGVDAEAVQAFKVTIDQPAPPVTPTPTPTPEATPTATKSPE